MKSIGKDKNALLPYAILHYLWEMLAEPRPPSEQVKGTIRPEVRLRARW